MLTGDRSEELDELDPPREVLRAYAPYALIVVIFSAAQIPPVKDWLARTTRTFDRPFLDVAGPDGVPVGGDVFSWPVVSTGGTLVLLAGILTAVVSGVHARVAVGEWLATVRELRFAIPTVTSVLALASVMNLSGRRDHRPLRRGGRSRSRLPVTRPRLVRRRRVRLGHLRQRSLRRPPGDRGPRVRTLARAAGRRQQLRRRPRQDDLPQNLTIACAAVGLAGREGDLLRKVLPWSPGLLLVMCLIVIGRSTPVLGWMLP